MKIYELLGHKDENTNFEKYTDYRKALSLYYSGSYTEAQKMFMNISGDEAAIMMAKRCQNALEGNIEVIDGVYEMKVK
ncbi:hypothetical protein KC711_03300 [Candidatus Peregrinibacteria bacterium]|nr:hypothetical protein [Candidatus Peregrinibacteria bacterium]MCB9805054.1 hypothetical protein [Candidatus Peribacteria bacterium]